MSNIFNKTNSPYLIAGTLATLALLASEVLIAAPYFKFLAPVASLNVSFPLIIGCAIVSFAVLAFSCVMIASNIMKTESDDKVPILVKVEGYDQPDSEPKPEEGAEPGSQANVTEGGTTPGSEPEEDAQRDNQADRVVEGAKPDNQRDGTAVPDSERDDSSGNSFTSGKVKEGQHAKVFAFASFVITGGVLFAANSLAGLIHNGVAIEGREMAVHGGQYQPPGYGSTRFEAEKNSDGTNYLLQKDVQERIVFFFKALKASNEGLSTALKEGEARGWDILPTSSLSNTQAEHNRELQVCS